MTISSHGFFEDFIIKKTNGDDKNLKKKKIYIYIYINWQL